MIEDGNALESANNNEQDTLSLEHKKTNEYNYYNENGLFIGHSAGSSPQDDLLQQAHYIFSSGSDALKNGVMVTKIENDIKKAKSQRLTTSVAHIGRLMDLNRKIENLEQLLEEQKAALQSPYGVAI